jgi:hypothetical protein
MLLYPFTVSPFNRSKLTDFKTGAVEITNAFTCGEFSQLNTVIDTFQRTADLAPQYSGNDATG